MLFYNPLHQIPTQSDLEAGRKLVDTIQQIKGDVLVPCHAYLPALAGKDWYADESAIAELVGKFGGRRNKEGKKIMDGLRQAIREKRFSAIILNVPEDSWLRWLRKVVKKYYIPFYNKTVFWPVTGRRTRPQFICVPRTSNID